MDQSKVVFFLSSHGFGPAICFQKYAQMAGVKFHLGHPIGERSRNGPPVRIEVIFPGLEGSSRLFDGVPLNMCPLKASAC